jgi:hypothetical protein
MTKPAENVEPEAVEAAVPLGPFDDVPEDCIRVPLSQHYEDKHEDGTSTWYQPGDMLVTRIATARSLLAAGYLAINPTDHAAVGAVFGRHRP